MDTTTAMSTTTSSASSTVDTSTTFQSDNDNDDNDDEDHGNHDSAAVAAVPVRMYPSLQRAASYTPVPAVIPCSPRSSINTTANTDNHNSSGMLSSLAPAVSTVGTQTSPQQQPQQQRQHLSAVPRAIVATRKQAAVISNFTANTLEVDNKHASDLGLKLRLGKITRTLFVTAQEINARIARVQQLRTQLKLIYASLQDAGSRQSTNQQRVTNRDQLAELEVTCKQEAAHIVTLRTQMHDLEKKRADITVEIMNRYSTKPMLPGHDEFAKNDAVGVSSNQSAPASYKQAVPPCIDSSVYETNRHDQALPSLTVPEQCRLFSNSSHPEQSTTASDEHSTRKRSRTSTVVQPQEQESTQRNDSTDSAWARNPVPVADTLPVMHYENILGSPLVPITPSVPAVDGNVETLIQRVDSKPLLHVAPSLPDHRLLEHHRQWHQHHQLQQQPQQRSPARIRFRNGVQYYATAEQIPWNLEEGRELDDGRDHDHLLLDTGINMHRGVKCGSRSGVHYAGNTYPRSLHGGKEMNSASCTVASEVTSNESIQATNELMLGDGRSQYCLYDAMFEELLGGLSDDDDAGMEGQETCKA
jgi:hypothetical protein